MCLFRSYNEQNGDRRQKFIDQVACICQLVAEGNCKCASWQLGKGSAIENMTLWALWII